MLLIQQKLLLVATDFDFFAGSDFDRPQNPNGGADLYQQAKESGYTVVRGYKEYQKRCKKADKMILLQSEEASKIDRGGLPYAIDQTSSDLNLADITRAAIHFLTKKPLHGGVFTIFAQGEFGNQGQYAVRPEIAITRRGGKLTEIASNVKNFYSENDINDIRYQLKGRYFDIRVPLIYQFLKKESAVRPYVYVAPALGFCLGGDISIEEQYEAGKGDNYYYDGCHLEMSKKNMSSLYFGAA